MYQVLIVGHGSLPQGVYEVLELIVGKQSNVFYKTVSETKGHDQFALEVDTFYQENDKILVFADLSGGAPHKICVRQMSKHQSKMIYVISGAPLMFLIDFVIANPLQGASKAQHRTILEELLQKAHKSARVMSR